MLDFMIFLPLLIVAAGAISLMLLSSVKKCSLDLAAVLSMGFFAVAFACQLALSLAIATIPFADFLREMLVVTPVSRTAGLVILGCGFFCCMMAHSYFTENRFATSEFYSLLLFAATGMLLLTMAAEFITLFIALEIMSLAIYALVGFNRRSERGSEAVLKYLVLGAFAGALYAMGTALIYGATASTHFSVLAGHFGSHGFLSSPVAAGGVLLILVAFLFKIAAFPFHAWSVDVYDGASLPVTGFMATGVKTAIFTVLVNFLLLDESMKEVLDQYLFYIAIITMLAGNLIAIGQNSLKRMLAASGIVHSGYLLVALVAIGSNQADSGLVLYYLAAYTVSTLGLFAALSYLSGENEQRRSFDDFRGMAKSRPYSAAAMVIFLLSMAGIPPTAGFMGKLYIITTAIETGYLLLAVLAIVSSILSMWYYLRLILAMYFQEPAQQFAPGKFCYASLGVFILTVSVFALSFYPVLI